MGPVETEVIIEKGIDRNGHLNNVWWGFHLEEGRFQAAAELGIDLNVSLQRLLINYDGQIFRGNRIAIATSATSKEDSIVFTQGIKRGDASIGSSLSVYANNVLPFEEPLSSYLSVMPLRLKNVFPSEGSALHHLAAPYYFEKGREWFLRQKRVDMEQLREEQGIRFVVVILDVRYFNPMNDGQTVQVRSGVEVDDCLIFFKQEMAEGEKILNSAQITCAIIDREDNLVDDPKVIRPIVKQLLAAP